ncbi:hypothetical protein C1N83_27705 (plasmid) [Priestia aryabhattai]|uniref:hypothetical protein n=1 Tax=Priestia TaxID=2800373 RepID=UPI000BFE585C|nr:MULTISPECIES: hypothetical protein [Priestia]MCM2978758.1 hypothetical protein [Priestia aryabhattai]PHF63861.1 hypothetical protein COI42_27575 [Priestia aryabhattai]
MKKWLSILFIICLFTLCAACSNVTWKKQYETSLPRELLSEGDEYSVLAVGKSIDHSEDIVGLKKVKYLSSLDQVKEEYPDLGIKESPFFIVYNDKEIVLRTSSLDKALLFIKENY